MEVILTDCRSDQDKFLLFLPLFSNHKHMTLRWQETPADVRMTWQQLRLGSLSCQPICMRQHRQCRDPGRGRSPACKSSWSRRAWNLPCFCFSRSIMQSFTERSKAARSGYLCGAAFSLFFTVYGRGMICLLNLIRNPRNLEWQTAGGFRRRWKRNKLTIKVPAGEG